MKWARHRRTRLALALLVTIVVAGALVWRVGRISRDGERKVLTWSATPSPSNSASANTSGSPAEINSPTSAPPSPTVSPSVPEIINPSSPTTPEAPPNLIIPVAGVRRDQLRDTFTEARSEGRVHDAIDIPAPLGTPVVAAANGKIVKLFQSERGGTTIYQLSSDSRFIYYYAHLDRYAENMVKGRELRQGETIAYVGDTGNAGPGNYHLHFSVAIVSDPKKYWTGVNINPYPLLIR